MPSRFSPRLISWIGWTLIVIGVLLLAARMREITLFASDFTQDYLAAQALRAGQSIYFATEDLSAEALGMGHALQSVSPGNNHPPFDAVVFVPLTLLPYDVAALLWSALSVLLYLFSGYVLLRELELVLARHWLVLLTGLALCWYPFQVHIALGQWSILVTACLILVWLLLRRRRVYLAGLLLGMAGLIKLFPGFLLLYLLSRRHWRAAGAMLLTLAAGGLLTLAVVGADDVIRFFQQVAPGNTAVSGPSAVNYALTGFFSCLFVDGPEVRPLVVAPQVAALVIAGSTIGLVGAFVYQARRAPVTPRGEDTAYALAVLTMLLVSPITWLHTFPLLALPCGLLVQDWLRGPHRSLARLSLLALTWVVFSLPYIQLRFVLSLLYGFERIPWFAAWVLFAPTAGLLVLWWMIAGRERARPSQPL